MRCKYCEKEASEGRSLHFSEIFGINRGKAVRRLHLNDLIVPKGVIRVFDCFFKDTSVLVAQNEVSMKMRALLTYKKVVQYNNKMKQKPILGNSYVVSRGTRMQIGYVHDRLVTYHGDGRWKYLLA